LIKVFLAAESRNLLKQLVVREIAQRYKGSALGLVWALIVPLSMLLVYTFVFRDVLGAKWPGAESGVDFALNLFSGLLVFNFFAEVLGRAPGLISEQPNLVKKVVFPLELLAWSSVLNSLFFAFVSLGVLFFGMVIFKGGLPLSSLSAVVALLIFTPFLVGLSWVIAALGVYVQDIKAIVSMIITPLMFLSPVFYPVTALPQAVQSVIVFNPVTLIIQAVRKGVLDGDWPLDTALLIHLCIGLLLFVAGFKLFRTLKRGFADVL